MLQKLREKILDIASCDGGATIRDMLNEVGGRHRAREIDVWREVNEMCENKLLEKNGDMYSTVKMTEKCMCMHKKDVHRIKCTIPGCMCAEYRKNDHVRDPGPAYTI